VPIALQGIDAAGHQRLTQQAQVEPDFLLQERPGRLCDEAVRALLTHDSLCDKPGGGSDDQYPRAVIADQCKDRSADPAPSHDQVSTFIANYQSLSRAGTSTTRRMEVAVANPGRDCR
jgi:hypothetical protein